MELVVSFVASYFCNNLNGNSYPNTMIKLRFIYSLKNTKIHYFHFLLQEAYLGVGLLNSTHFSITNGVLKY